MIGEESVKSHVVDVNSNSYRKANGFFGFYESYLVVNTKFYCVLYAWSFRISRQSTCCTMIANFISASGPLVFCTLAISISIVALISLCIWFHRNKRQVFVWLLDGYCYSRLLLLNPPVLLWESKVRLSSQKISREALGNNWSGNFSPIRLGS